MRSGVGGLRHAWRHFRFKGLPLVDLPTPFELGNPTSCVDPTTPKRTKGHVTTRNNQAAKLEHELSIRDGLYLESVAVIISFPNQQMTSVSLPWLVELKCWLVWLTTFFWVLGTQIRKYRPLYNISLRV